MFAVDLLLEAIDIVSGERQECIPIDVVIDDERSPGLYRSRSSVVTTAYAFCDLVA